MADGPHTVRFADSRRGNGRGGLATLRAIARRLATGLGIGSEIGGRHGTRTRWLGPQAIKRRRPLGQDSLNLGFRPNQVTSRAVR